MHGRRLTWLNAKLEGRPVEIRVHDLDSFIHANADSFVCVDYNGSPMQVLKGDLREFTLGESEPEPDGHHYW